MGDSVGSLSVRCTFIEHEFWSRGMKLIALSMVKNEEYWIWYSLTSVYDHVDEILVFDNNSEDKTVEIVRSLWDPENKITLVEGFGGDSEQENREAMLNRAREHSATHIMYLDGDEVHIDENMRFCRQLLEMHEHSPELNDPPSNPHQPLDCSVTDGALIKNIGFRPIHPGFAGMHTCRPHDQVQPDTDHSCYNYAIRISSLTNLHGNGKEWGQHGYLETDDIYIQSSAQTLWLPKLWYYHFSWHPRSSVQGTKDHYRRDSADLGSVPQRPHIYPPHVLLRRDGPGNPTLDHWRKLEREATEAACLADSQATVTV